MASKALNNHSLSSLSSSSSSLVNSITKILQSLKLTNCQSIHTPQNFPPLSQFSLHLNPNLVIQVINNQTSPYHALFFFNWASNSMSSSPNPNPNNYSHTFPCYIAMVDLFLSHRLFTTTTQFLESHNKLSDFMIGKLIKAFGDCGDIRGVIDWFHRAKIISKNCVFSCNSLLGVLVRSNRLGLAHAIFNQVVNEGVISLDISTYTTMIRGYSKMGKIDLAQKLFDEMPCTPNLVTYNTIVGGFCRKGMMVNARKVVDRMIMSEDCLPDLVTYTTLIDGYCKNGEMETAITCLDEMVRQGCEPNLMTYNAIVNGFCLGGKIDDAKRMMTKMRLNGVKDDVVTHTSLLKGFCVVGRLDEAVKHLRDMTRLGLKPDVKAYGVVVNECCKLGKANEAIALLKEMKSRGVNPSISSFNAVVKSLTESGELNEAVLLLKWMLDMGCAPNFLSYSTVISNLCKTEGRAQEVEELVHLMLQNGHKLDNYLYSCLTKMYSKCGNLEMAIRISYDALRTGHVINLESFTVLTEELCAKGKISEVVQQVREMNKRFQVTHVDDYERILKKITCQYSDEKFHAI